jgi:hypothetical protein
MITVLWKIVVVIFIISVMNLLATTFVFPIFGTVDYLFAVVRYGVSLFATTFTYETWIHITLWCDFILSWTIYKAIRYYIWKTA